ncbi:MAG TPA: hypothetical protein EYG73_02695 [Arcobacter sp.]|nr:hypothetical protein [Arcobacter sp.]
MHIKTYIKTLFIILGLIALIVITYLFYFAKHYPIPVTNRASFDAKLKFIRENINVNEVDTLIVGSSVGLNNIQGTYLEKDSTKCKVVLNLSVHGAYTRQTRQLLELTDAFPKLERILYVGQYTDLGITHQFNDYNPDFLMKYMRNEMNLIEKFLVILRACNNLFFCINRQRTWKKMYKDKDSFHYIEYDSTGSVPLQINAKITNPGRWGGAQPGHMPEVSYGAIYHMSKRALNKGLKFYFIQQPHREAIVKRDSRVRNALATFSKRVSNIMKENHGVFINLHTMLRLDDTHFSDRNHLNDKGSKVEAKKVAKIIDIIEK